MNWKLSVSAAAAAMALICAAPASAAVTIYTSQATFSADTHGGVTDGFETAPTGGATFYTSGYFAPLFEIHEPNSMMVNIDPGANASAADWGSGDIMAYGGGTTATFTFYNPVTAFSIELMTFSPYGGTITVAGAGFSSPVVTAARPTRTFFGLTSTTGLMGFTLTSAGGYYGEFDNLTLAIAGAGAASAAGPEGTTSGTPEPASWALTITGLALTGAALRRRRTTVAA